jgi:methyltransferase (TIGR00027 family)
VSALVRELHRSSRPSSTAEATTFARAAELRRSHGQRIVTDQYAPYFLSPAGRALVRSLRFAPAAVGAFERSELAGPLTFSLCRHRFIDVHLVGALDDGAEQVLVLGAGYDSRAYRFAQVLHGRPVHEVDLAPISRRKAGIVSSHPDVFGHASIRRVEIDFRTESLAERLLESGFAVGAQTFVVWEGVSMYLDRPAVEGTLSTLRDLCGPASTLAMDFWQPVAGRAAVDHARRLVARSFALIGEPLTFAVDPAAADKLLASFGFSVLDVAGAEELEARYSTGDRPCERSAYVVAARRR